jgi:isochorismate pyruvate lyase
MTSLDQKIKPADQCLDMTDLRAQIDALDRGLIAALAARQRYIERAAEIKRHRSDVRDEGRIADVLTKITAAAERNGLNVEIARAVWTTLMERSIALELDRFDRLQAFR